jgi:hypothetical protein
MIGCLIILIIFTFPETAYNRSYDDSDEDPVLEDKKDLYRASTGLPSKKKSYWRTISLFTGERYTQDSLWKMFTRPFGLILLPPVLWATAVKSALFGSALALLSACKLHLWKILYRQANMPSLVANDFHRVYHFTPFQAGLGFLGGLVGGFLASMSYPKLWDTKLILVAVPAGGPVGEAVANYFTVRNRGIREPEFRLPAIAISVITAPLGLVLYGAGLQYKLHFMVPIVGLGLGMKSGWWHCK